MLHAVTAEESGKRADLVVAGLTGASRAAIALAVLRGDVRVDGQAVKGSRPLEAGETLEYEVSAAEPLRVEAERIPLSIVYEDDDLMVVDKVAGMVTHPAHGTRGGTLVNAVLGHVAGALPGDAIRSGLVHRLDRYTSGLIVVAKTLPALTELQRQMKTRCIRREYLGLVRGVPAAPYGTIQGAIGRDPHNRLKFAVTSGGKAAITHYDVREAFGNYAELAFRLETGRTHQIRVHAAAMGHPIVNDPLYGRDEPRLGLPGQALHAFSLAFSHPRTNAPLAFTADPPPAYATARDRLRDEA